VSAFIKAYPNLLGYHMWSTWDQLTAVSTYGPPSFEEEDEPDSGCDFSGLRAPSAMRDFVTACDYCLSDCSDDGHNLDDEGCGPSHECFHVDLAGHNEGNHLGMPEDDDPPGPAPRVDILRELAVVLVPAGGLGHTARANPRDAGQARRGSRTTCAAPAKHRAGVGRLSTRQRSPSSAPGCPTPYRRRCQGKAAPGLQRGRPESGCSGNTTPSDAGAIHHRGAVYPGRTQESPGGRRGPTGRELCLPKARVPPGASRRDFSIHARSLGPHRAHAGRDACSPGSPRQRPPPPRPSSPPRRKGASRLPPQAWGTLR
jgi:hypothetical protein